MLGLLMSQYAQAQTRTFTSRFSTNKTGDILIVGNTLMTCAGSCPAVQNASTAPLNNNSYSMVYTNSDGFAALSTPFVAPANSSRATLNMPLGSTVEFAGLYWGGDSTSTARNRARFVTPLSDTLVTATQVDTSGTAATATYQGFIDVTLLVRSAGNGSYTVGNVQSTTGTNRYAGWSLVVAYSNPAEQARNLSVFDGMQNTAVTINVGPFISPPSGPVNARLGFVAYEGDRGTTGDAAQFRGTKSAPASVGTLITLTDAANPVNDFFNSTISRFGVNVTGSKTPDYINQLGFDIDVMQIPNAGNTVIRNGDDGATIILSSGGDAFYPGVITSAIDVFLPNLTSGIVKTMVDVNGGLLAAGDIVEYSLSFTNTGNDWADLTILNDPIPTNTTYVPGSLVVASGANAGNKTDAAADDQCEYVVATPKITCRMGTGASSTLGGTFNPGDSTSVKFKVKLGAVSVGTVITNTATVNYTARTVNLPLVATTNVSSAATGPADLTVTKAHTGNFSQGQQNAQYRITVSNGGATTVAPFQIVDTLPAGLTFVSGSGTGWSCTAAGQVVTCSNSNAVPLTGGATSLVTLNVNVSGAAATPLLNAVRVSGGGESPAQVGNNDATDSTIIAPASDLTIAKTHVGNFAQGATGRTYSITVSNAGGAATSGTVTMTDALPVGLTATAIAGTGWTCTLGTRTCTRADALAAGASYPVITLTVSVAAGALGPLDNYAEVSGGGEVNTTNNSALDPTNITPTAADLIVTKTHIGNFTQSQTNAQYTVTITNSGLTATTAAAVNVVDTPPSGMTVTAMSGTGWTCTVATRTCTRTTPAALAPAASYEPIAVTVTIAANATSPLTNNVAVSGGGEFPANNTNNSDADTTVIVPVPDLTVAKTPVGGSFTQAQLGAKYTITVTNGGGTDTTAAFTVTDTLPAGLTFVSGAGTNYSCSSIGQVVTCVNNNLAPIPAGATSVLTLTVDVAPTASLLLVNNVSVSGGGELVTTNNTGSHSTIINPYVGVTVTKSFAAANITAGSPALLTVNLSNSTVGIVTLTSAFADTLPVSPGNMVIATPSNLGGTCTGVTADAGAGTLTKASGSTIPVGGCSITVDVTSLTSGPYTNNIAAGALVTSGGSSPTAASANLNVYAPIAISKAFSPTTIAVNGTSTLTFTLSNANVATLTNANFTDTLTGMTVASVTTDGTCAGVTNSPTLAVGAATLNLTVPNLLAGSCTVAVQVTSTASGTYPNTASGATSTQTTVGPASNTAILTVSAPPGVFLNGTVYNDANHNLQRDAGEGATALPLYAKLVAAGGAVALQQVTVNAGTGAYQFTGVAAGNYFIILDDNNVLNDIAPNVPAGWIGAEMPDFTRSNIQVGAAELQNLNFGLFNGGKLSGMVFGDTGLGSAGGTPNDGVKNGTEAGIAGVTVKVTNSAGTTTFDSTVTDGDGRYTLWIPAIGVSATLKVVQTNLSGDISTGASMGNTGGSYDRASDSITFGSVSGGIFTGVNFGDVPVNRFVANGQQSGAPGNVVFYPHQFNAGSSGSVTLSVVSASNWPVVMYRDLNCNGVIDAGDPIIGAAFSLAANEQLCMVNKVTIPPGTATSVQDVATLQAVFTYTNANPALGATLSVIDSTTVGAGSTGLVLTKTADKATALPGDTITYTVSYQNNSSAPIGTIVISDATPAFTAFVSAACSLPLPAAISACNIIAAPAPAGGTSIQWTLTGSLSPASVGQVVFVVRLNN